ncbi:MAG: Trm112 family protein [Candidatus Aureabacteria bacterium]|nr:Trm112 family protein [Candidatus Auribacterota bacterium]
MVDKKLIDILACPACKGDVFEDKGSIECKECGRQYPVVDDIPVMLVDEAKMPENKKNEENE